MAIYKTIDIWDFRKAFANSGRSSDYSGAALEFLFEQYSDLEKDWELDVIAICCEWTEYDEPNDLWEAYGYLIGGKYDPDRFGELLEAIGDRTNYRILENHSIMVQDF